MKIVNSSHGKFHHQDLARQLEKHGVLERYFTGYPRWKLKSEGLPLHRTSTFPWVEVPYMGLLKFGLLHGAFERRLARLQHDAFDAYVAAHLPPCDAYIGLSCASLKAGTRAKELGALYVCDRGSSHILTQDKLLREEFARHGATFRGIDPWVLEREQAEYQAADLITVPSEFVRRTFLDQGVPECKLAKVPYGVNLARFQPVAEPASDRFDIAFVGQVSFRKGLPDLLAAYRAVRHPRKHLTIVGGMTGEVKQYLKSNPLPAGVTLTGHIPQPRLKEVLSRSHVMVLPSLEEGLALVMAQALACGCPVIATEHTGAGDLFEDEQQGFFVPVRDPAAITDRLQRLAENPDLQANLRARALALTQHALGGWDAYGRRMLEAIARRLETGEPADRPDREALTRRVRDSETGRGESNCPRRAPPRRE